MDRQHYGNGDTYWNYGGSHAAQDGSGQHQQDGYPIQYQQPYTYPQQQTQGEYQQHYGQQGIPMHQGYQQYMQQPPQGYNPQMMYSGGQVMHPPYGMGVGQHPAAMGAGQHPAAMAMMQQEQQQRSYDMDQMNENAMHRGGLQPTDVVYRPDNSNRQATRGGNAGSGRGGDRYQQNHHQTVGGNPTNWKIGVKSTTNNPPGPQATTSEVKPKKNVHQSRLPAKTSSEAANNPSNTTVNDMAEHSSGDTTAAVVPPCQLVMVKKRPADTLTDVQDNWEDELSTDDKQRDVTHRNDVIVKPPKTKVSSNEAKPLETVNVVKTVKPTVKGTNNPSPANTQDSIKTETPEQTDTTSTLTVKDKAKNENLAIIDPRPHLNIVFIGHVDAGKSTTCGNILYLTGQVDERAIEKFVKDAKDKNRDSWVYAFIMDINEEERVKGKTVEVGRALFETANRRYTILDAPGHKSFVPSMISGAAQADIAVLIISARKGEFETGFEKGGQTREHALLAKTLGVSQIIVAVNKMDDQTCEWCEARYREIEKKLTPFLKNCGFNPAKDIFYVPMSGLTGQNLMEPVSDPSSKCYNADASWYPSTLPTLFSLLDSLQPPDRSPTDPLRIPLLEGYKDQGTMAVGKVESGQVTANCMAMIMPANIKVKITAVLVNNLEVRSAPPGENVVVSLLGIEDDSITKGSVLSYMDFPCPVVQRFKGQIMILDLLEHRPLLTAGYSCVLHAHTACEECQFIKLIEVVDKVTKKKKSNPSFVKSNAMLICEIQLENPICLETFAVRPQLGRFTLRDEGKTMGIGKILEITDIA